MPWDKNLWFKPWKSIRVELYLEILMYKKNNWKNIWFQYGDKYQNRRT